MTITIQRLRSIFRKANITGAKWSRSGRIRGWGHWHGGYHLEPLHLEPETFEERSKFYITVGYGRRKRQVYRPPVLGYLLSYHRGDWDHQNTPEVMKRTLSLCVEAMTNAKVKFEKSEDGTYTIPVQQ